MSAKSKAIVINPQAPKFEKRNPAFDLKRVLEPAITASILTGENAMVVGAVGMGKSEIAFYASRQIFGAEHVALIECTPSTPEAHIKGHDNFALYVDPDLIKKGAPKTIVTGTALDPEIKVVILDEWPRLSEPAQHALVHVMHNLRENRPAFWATANWTKQDKQTEAVRDRVAMTILYNSPKMDVEAILRVAPIKTWHFDVPDAKTVTAVKEMLTQPVPEKSFRILADLLVELNRLVSIETEGVKFTIDNRRVIQWKNILLATSYLEAGELEFNKIADMGINVLRYCYPVISEAEKVAWARVVSKVADVVGSAIAEFESNAFIQWQAIMAAHNGRRGQSNREELIKQLGTVLADAQETLETNWPDDERAIAASNNMNDWYRRVCRGENL